MLKIVAVEDNHFLFWPMATDLKGKSMSDLKAQFEASVNYVQNAEGDFKPDNDTKLAFYSLFKQATEGDVKGKRPGMTNFIGRAKWDAWNNVKGMSSDEAMQKYIDRLESLKNKHA